MKSSKPEAIKLPYASAVASYSQDQGGFGGNSFLGRLFKKGALTGSRFESAPNMMSPSGTGILK